MANGGVIDFYHPVVSYGLIEPYISLAATNTRGFFKKRLIFRKRNLSLTKILAEEPNLKGFLIKVPYQNGVKYVEVAYESAKADIEPITPQLTCLQ